MKYRDMSQIFFRAGKTHARLEAYRSQDALYAKPNCRGTYCETRTVEQAVAKGQQGESFLFFRSALGQRQLALKVLGNMFSQHF